MFDVDDFYRAGLIPLDRVMVDRFERDRFVADARARLKRWGKPDAVIDEYVNAFDELLSFFPAQEWKGRYQGTTEQRALLRSWTSWLVSRYVREGISWNAAAGATGRAVTPVPQMKSEVEILKQLVWHYVIENPALLTQQQGVRFVMQSLFKFFMDRAETGNFDIFPEPYRAALSSSEDDEHARTVIDMISGMTEVQALRLHARLMGVSLGSVLDRL